MYIDRNQRIVNDRLSGLPIHEIAKKHALSRSRIVHIIDSFRKKSNQVEAYRVKVRELKAKVIRLNEALAVANRVNISGSSKIEDISMSERATNCLKAAGISTVQEVRDRSDADMLRTPNLGRKTLVEIRAITGDY